MYDENNYRDDVVSFDPAFLTERQWRELVERDALVMSEVDGMATCEGFRRDIFVEVFGAGWEAELHADR